MKNRFIFLFMSLVLLILGLTGGYTYFLHAHFQNWSDSGVFGDTFGALNSIFSGIALAGLVTTIVMQRKQIDEQTEFNKLQYLQGRYEYLVGQIKAWKQTDFNYENFFLSVEDFLEIEHTDRDYDFKNSIYLHYGSQYAHFIYMLMETIKFIVKDYVPNNGYIENSRMEVRMLTEIVKSKLSPEDFILIAIHAVLMEDDKLAEMIDQFELLAHLDEGNYAKYNKITELMKVNFIKWENINENNSVKFD